MKLKQVRNLVQMVLEENEEARNDNFVLVARVYEKLGVPISIQFNVLINEHKERKLPSFESICRARRKVIEQFPNLNGNKKNRMEEEQKYIEFVRENNYE